MNMAPSVGAGSLSEDQAAAILAYAGVSFVLTDPNLPDNPIVYVNDAFERITGYPREQVLGRNCRFLQGEDTDPDHRRALREAIEQGRDAVVDILNHRADGTSFRNRLLVTPVRDPQGRIVHFLGVQKALSPLEARRARSVSVDDALREIEHRVKNHLAMILGLVRLQSREEGGPAGYERLARRVQGLQLLYEELSQAARSRGADDLVPLGPYLARVGAAVAELDGRPGLRLETSLAPLSVPVETAARIGLVLSEVLSNALEHAFPGPEAGLLSVRLEAGPEGGARLTVRDDGVGLPPGATWPDRGSMGGRIVAGLVDALGATLAVESGPEGTRVTLDVPAALPQD